MSKIEINNIYKVFGSHPEKAISLIDEGKTKEEVLSLTGQAVGVANASFNIEEGETLVIMGLSGSGKSTLLRCLNRLIEPSMGTITINGTDVTKLSSSDLREFRRKTFGMVFQKFALLPHRTVLDNAAFGLELQNIDEKTRRTKAMESLELVGLKGWENSYPEHLSGGMQQRVGLARALAVEPDILLMDEAFSALDPLIRTEMQDELLALEDQVKKTIVFITHDLDEALRIGDRIVLMKDGRVVQVGTTEEILKNPATRYVERFVENVDMTKVLTAGDVMVKASHVTVPKDGPRTALHLMKEKGISSIFALDKGNRLNGIINAEDAQVAVDKGKEALDDVIVKYEKYITSPGTPLKDILPVMVDNRYPVAVVDDKNRLMGMIVRGSVIAGLVE